ncbi:hypothetical protein Tco_0937551 [Tanacetum coccineum]|uniref:Uncharacterized protein n=1 Tax=Tanacetum coccineum TaxID=301880 RepID=A0ABQ5DEK2_9ASTR
MLPLNNLSTDESGVFVNETQFRGMIGSLTYLIASRHDIQFFTCLCARFQANPNESHLVVLSMLLLLGAVLKSSRSKVSWLIIISSMTRYHFIMNHILKGDIELHFVPTDLQLADIFTKPLAEPSFTRLVAELEGSDAAYCQVSRSLLWGLNVDTGNILFFDLVSKLVNGKKGRELNVCYTKSFSLIIEHLLGNAYNNDKLKSFKPHHISATSFKTPFTNEVALIPYMQKVANISIETEQTLILPSKEVNTGNTTEKSLFETTVQPVGQPKVSTDKKLRKKKIPSSSKPKTSKNVMQSKPKKTVINTQHAEESVATVDATKSLETSKVA